MKKILVMALIMTGGFFSAEAQGQSKEVCNSKKACYRTKYSENFKVCKNDDGYYICGETPTYANSTIRGHRQMQQRQYKQPEQTMQYAQNTQQQQYEQQDAPANTTSDALIAPQSQSYATTPSFDVSSVSSYEGYYPKKHYIQVSGDNVAEDNRAPYEGMPSPQYDGPAKNAERNLNASNPNADLAPITGRPE